MINKPETDAIEAATPTNSPVIVPITKELHFKTPVRQRVIESEVNIVDAVAQDDRTEATLVAMVTTERGRMEALIRVPREIFNNSNLAGRTQARFSNDLQSLVFA